MERRPTANCIGENHEERKGISDVLLFQRKRPKKAEEEKINRTRTPQSGAKIKCGVVVAQTERQMGCVETKPAPLNHAGDAEWTNVNCNNARGGDGGGGGGARNKKRRQRKAIDEDGIFWRTPHGIGSAASGSDRSYLSPSVHVRVHHLDEIEHADEEGDRRVELPPMQRLLARRRRLMQHLVDMAEEIGEEAFDLRTNVKKSIERY